jgi:hypothetical protein
MKTILAPTGVITLEFPHVMRLIDENQFDTIYHEHFSYFSLVALDSVFGRHGLRVFDLEHLAVHGGSVRVFVARSRQPTQAVGLHRNLECSYGLYDPKAECYTEFTSQVEDHVKAIRGFLDNAEGLVVGAGAPAKGNTLLNAAGATADDLAYVTDTSPHKQGKYLPGSHVPVVAPWQIGQPEKVLVLAWNWFDEIKRSFAGLDAEFVHPLRLA